MLRTTVWNTLMAGLGAAALCLLVSPAAFADDGDECDTDEQVKLELSLTIHAQVNTEANADSACHSALEVDPEI